MSTMLVMLYRTPGYTGRITFSCHHRWLTAGGTQEREVLTVQLDTPKGPPRDVLRGALLAALEALDAAQSASGALGISSVGPV